MSEESVVFEGMKQAGASALGDRKKDAIYQKGKAVASVVEPEVDLEAGKIRFGEVRDSDHLVIADECEFQKYVILIQKIAFATKVDRRPGQKGRTLAGCSADILRTIE